MLWPKVIVITHVLALNETDIVDCPNVSDGLSATVL